MEPEKGRESTRKKRKGMSKEICGYLNFTVLENKDEESGQGGNEFSAHCTPYLILL